MLFKNHYSILFLAFLLIGFGSCRKKGCTDSAATNYDAKAKKDDGTCTYPTGNNIDGYNVTFQFSHNYNGTSVTAANFNNLSYVNAAGNKHSITRLRYLVSGIRFFKSNGDSIVIDGYQLVDLSDNNSLSFTTPDQVAAESYTGIAFNFGFIDSDNTTGAYPDLNAANWSWPEMLGGGYHFMQFEGSFIDTNTDTLGFTYHMGTAREITATDTIFHDNHFLTKLNNSGFTLSNDAAIEIKMDISEWFKNPYTWDLNTYYNTLMPNYNAQLLMNDNGRSVFSIGTITQ